MASLPMVVGQQLALRKMCQALSCACPLAGALRQAWA